MSVGAQITIFTKIADATDQDGALLSKRISLGPDGKPLADGSLCRMANGLACMADAPDAAALARLIDGLRPCDALALGSIAGGNGATMNVVTAATLARMPAEQRGNNTIARTREFIAFTSGTPAWMLIDFDRKGMPAEVTARIEAAGGLWPALLAVVPGLDKAACVLRASTSAGLSREDTGERFASSGGVHAYALVGDGADVDRALRALHERCWAHGLGWYLIGAAGQLLERSIVDATVRFPERLVFEGKPDIVLPLVQDAAARATEAIVGAAIDTRIVIPDLTRDEALQVEAAKRAARQALEPEARAVRAAADGRLVEDLVNRTGMPHASALRQVQARHRGVLMSDLELVFDHLGVVTVRQILGDPERFVGETLADPLEGVAYGTGKALVMRSQREPGRLFIHSFAHGGGTYDLKYDLQSAKALLEAAPIEALGDLLCEVVAAAELEPEEIRQLIALCGERAPKIGFRAFAKRLKLDQERRHKEQRRAAAERERADPTDRRERRPAPRADQELTPIVLDLERVLADDDSDYPPMRQPDGTLVELRTFTPFAMHQLAANGANGEDDPVRHIPAPAEPLLVPMSAPAVSMMIERFFIWEQLDKDGGIAYHATLPSPFVAAFMELAGSESKLPVVHAVSMAPMVAMNGALIDGVGLDRDSGLLHHIDPALRDCIPRGDITEADVREAVTWLCDEWFVDVLTDRTGKLVAISVALSMIERHLLPARPAFLISAGLRGGGKTTLCHMLTLAAFGRMASAASWSESQEERRKALFSYFRQGVATLVWDNIRNGAEIACPEIEKALTSPTIQDRILGVSRGATVPTTAIQLFVGNNIRFVGDMASRGPEIRLATNDPNPENRPVMHADPLAWTLENRARILRALYTIILFGCRERPSGQVAKTRFRMWWSLIGYPVERAAELIGHELDFVERFKAAEAHDSKAVGVASALRLLRGEFGSVERWTKPQPEDWWRARRIREILDAGERARALLRTNQTGQQDIDRANAFLEMVAELTGKRTLSPITKIISEALGGIVDRPVNLDDATVGILRTHILHGATEFLVETHTRRDAAENTKTAPASDLERASRAHPAHPTGQTGASDETPSAPLGGQGGHGGHLPGRDFAGEVNFPAEGVPAPEPPALLPTVEGVPAAEGLILDVETFSTVDLKKVGLHYYAAHPTTGVSVACHAFGSAGDVRTWQPGEPVPAEIERHITAGGRLIAHNSHFEAAILRHVLGPRHGWPIPKPEQWTCTLARAAYHGFPPSLEELSGAVPLDNRKDKGGHALMLRMSRPRSFRPDGTPRWWHEEDPGRLVKLTDYCSADVLAEQELDRRLPELPERERRLWLMDAEINDRGLLIDIVGAQALADAVEAEVATLDAELGQLTGGAVSAVTNPGALKAWLGGRGLRFASLDKEHLAGALEDPAVMADPAAYRALQLRQEGAKASTAKLKPMLGTLGADDRARGLFQYYGALRTGRWAGRRIQPQNLVRGHADATAIIDAMVAGAKLEDLAQQYQSGRLELVAGCLRGLFVAPPGKRLVVADLAQIEARVLAWLAGQEDLLDVFRNSERDVYVFTADRLRSDDRQLGKVATLGLGFQMGAERFVDAAKGYGLVLSEDEAAQHVAQWRSDHPAIVRLWWDVADTFAAIAGGSVGDEAEVGRCLVYRRPGSVRIRLPSGRELIYHQMQLVERPGSPRGELMFMGPHPLSRKWTQQRTYGGKLVENITQATARDVLSETMLELHARGHSLLGSIHDEILLEAEAAAAETLLEETLALMRTPPAWAEGLPVEAEGFVSPRYRKA